MASHPLVILLALMVVASASAGPVSVIEISPGVGLHFDQEDTDLQRHLVKRSPFLKKIALSSAFGLAAEAVPLAAAAGAGGLGGAAAPFIVEALPLGISVFSG